MKANNLSYTENKSFGMDDVGNRTTVNLRSGSQVYDVNDLTNRYNAIDNDDCTYDAAGNLTVDHNGYQYTYDYENRITWIGNSGGGVAAFDYDALGRRIRIFDYKSISLANYYYNDQWQVLYKEGPFGYNSCTYVWGNYIDEALAMNTYYYAHDHLYSPAALTDSAGTVVERYECDAYGTVSIMAPNYELRTASLYANSYTFTGRELDIFDNGNLKIMYYRNRYYSPEIGRFLTHDPLGIVPNSNENVLDPLYEYWDGMNLFEYIKSSPLTSLDPAGLFGQCGPGWLGGIIVPDDPWPFGGANFTDACRNHDDCYAGGQNGSRCNTGKDICDEQFRQDMYSACVNKYANATDWFGNPLPRDKKDKKIAACFKIANIYADAVANHGDGSFNQGRRGCPCNTP